MEKEKYTFKDRMSNIWYYYKWMIIIFGVLIIALIVACVQLFAQRESDVDLMYIGAGVLSVKDCGELKDFVASNITDVNGDGTKEIGFLELTAHTDNVSTDEGEAVINYDTNNAVLQRFENEVRAGDAVIYLCDDYYYDRLRNIGVLAPLASILTSAEMPERTYDEYGVYIKDLGLSLAPGFSSLPDTTIVCMRRSPEDDALKYGRTLEQWTANKLLFVKLVTYAKNEVVYNDTEVNIVYYGDTNIDSQEQYYFKSFVLGCIDKKDGFGDTFYEFAKVTPPIIVKGNESQEAMTDEELYADLVGLLSDGKSYILICDKDYFDKVMQYGSPVLLETAGIQQKVVSDEAAYKYAVTVESLQSKPSLICSLKDDAFICITEGSGYDDNLALLKNILKKCAK